MEITCKKCGTRLKITNTGSPIVKCGNCGYPNPVTVSSSNNATPQTPVAKVAPASVTPPPPIPNPRPNINAGTGVKQDYGWLIVHDENAPSQTHTLRLGRQVIGRLNSSSPCDIMINSQDVFMSRNHCVLEVKPNRSGGFDYLLSDRKTSGGTPENMSTNGTFVNAIAKPLQPNDVVYLNDGDTIQMGTTKAIIKTIKTVANAQDATRIVQDSDYTPTVIIK